MAPCQGHCEVRLLRYLVDPDASGVHTQATSHSSCYPGAMLGRVVGLERGHAAEFMLRIIYEARVDLRWIAGLQDGVGGWGEDVVRALEESLLAVLQSLMAVKAEPCVDSELREVGDPLRWR